MSDSNGKVNQKDKVKSLFIDMIENLSHMYYSHHIIIKCVGFKSIHYTINLDIASSIEYLANLIM